MLAKADSKPAQKLRPNDLPLRTEDRIDRASTAQGAPAGSPGFLGQKDPLPFPVPRKQAEPKAPLKASPKHAPVQAKAPKDSHARDKQGNSGPSVVAKAVSAKPLAPATVGLTPIGGLAVATRGSGAVKEPESEPLEPAEPPEPFGEIAIDLPEPLVAPAIDATYEGPTSFPSDVVIPVVAGQTPDPLNATALDHARAEFGRIADLAQQNHGELKGFLIATASEVESRHNALVERTAASIGATGLAMDHATLEAQAGVARSEEQALKSIDRASLHARHAVWGTATVAKQRIAANADSAEEQVKAIIRQLAQSYTDLLSKVSEEIAEKGKEAVTAIAQFVTTGAAKFPRVPDPIEDVKNEASRAEVPHLNKFEDAVSKNATETATQYTNQIEPIRQQFRQSELGKALDQRKGEIRNKGDKAVDKASGEAIHSLEKSAREAQNSARKMGRNGRKTLESYRKAFRARMAGEGRSLMAVSRGESMAALNGLSGASKVGLPAFGNTVTAIEKGLRHAAESGARPLEAASAGAAADAPGRLGAIARLQREKLGITHAGTRLSIETREALSQADVQSDRDTSVAAVQSSSRDAARQITESAAQQTSSFDSVAKGVAQAAKEWETPIAEVFDKAIQTTVAKQKTDTGEGSFKQWSDETNKQKDTFIDKALAPYLDPPTCFKPILNDAASKAYKRVDDGYAEVVAALNSGIIDVVDETRLGNALRGLTAIQGVALAAKYKSGVGTDLDEKLQFLNATRDLSDNDLAASRAYLAGNTAEGAAYEMRASIHWYNDEESRIENIMRGLNADDLQKLKGSKDGHEALDYVRDHLDGADLNVVDALAVGNHARADAYRMQEAVDEARRKGDDYALHTVLAQYSGASTDRGWQADAATRRVAVQQELAQILGGGGASDAASTIAPKEAARQVEAFALRPVEVYVPEGEGGGETITLNVTGANRDLASALIQSGEGSVDARAARLAVEMQRPDKPNILNLDTALVDPRLNPNNNAPAAERKTALEERNQVFEKFAEKYGASNPELAKRSAQDFALQQVRASFGDDELGANLAGNLVTEAVPSPDTAALAMQYAARGLGTKEDIVWRFTERLNRDEVAQMRAAYKRDTGTSLDDDYGSFGHGGWFTEMSGDDRLRLERALLGQPRNDQERAEVAAFTAQQQRDNTGWLGKALGSGSDQDRALSFEEERLQSLVGAKIKIDDDGNPVWFGPDGQPLKGDPKNFENGHFKGDADEFASSVRLTQAAAQNYAARIDTYANFAATAIAIIGAVAATILTGGAASPLLAAAIAGGAGLAGMAAHWAISGGRYGWEQAVTDLGMTAVQALTAGVGQHLALLSRGATTSFAAGMTTFGKVANVTEHMGQITGSAFADTVLIGSATSGMSSLGTAALNEKTWDKGIGEGFEELLGSTLRGMASGGATASVSQAFEKIPLGEAGNIANVMGSSENAMVRAGLRGTTSALGGFAGRGVEMGLDPNFHGDSGDYFEDMAKAGLQAGFQDAAGNLAESGVQDYKKTAGKSPPTHEEHEQTAQHEVQPAHPEQAPHEAGATHATAAHEAVPPVPQIAPPTEHVPLPPEAAPATAPVQVADTPEHAATPTEAEKPAEVAAQPEAPVVTPEESFADFASLVAELEQSPLGETLEAARNAPAMAIPADPSRTQKQAYDAAYRDSRQSPPGEKISSGEQIQHYTKVLDATTKLPPGTAPLHPDAINENRSFLQSRRDEPARTLLTDPAGGGTRYFIGDRPYGGAGEPLGRHEQVSFPGMEPPPPEHVYNTEHKLADQYLIPEIADHIQARRNELGLAPLDPRALAIAAGEQARWVLEGTPGTTRSGASIELGRAGPQQLLLAPEILAPELHARGLSVEPAEAAHPAADPRQTELDFDRPAPNAMQGELQLTRGAAAGGTAAAVGGRFRGDYAASSKVSGGDVSRALDSLLEGAGPFAGHAKRAPEETFEFSLRARNEESVNVRVEIVPEMRPEAGAVPVARWDRNEAGEYIVTVSNKARPSEVERALAHEFAEIRAAHGVDQKSDALRPGGSGSQLSAHDQGRLAELEVLSRQLGTATEEKDRLRLQDDAERLVDHLGLTGDSDAARARANVARKALPPDSPMLRLLESAIVTARENPFLQETTRNLHEDLQLLDRRYELALSMGDQRAQADVLNDARVLLIGQGAVGPTPGAPRGTMEGSRVYRMYDEAKAKMPRSSLLEQAFRAAEQYVILHDSERAAAGRQPVAAEGFNAVPKPPEYPGVDVGRAAMAPIEKERNRLFDERKRILDAKGDLTKVDEAIRKQSERAGELAGRTYAEQVLNLPAASLVEFGRSGKNLPDLFYRNGDRIVLVECKGGDSPLKPRKSVDKTFYVGQGTHEYLRSLATDMAKSGNAEVQKAGKAILEELKRPNPRIDYYLAQQPFDSDGRAMSPEIWKFDLSQGKVK